MVVLLFLKKYWHYIVIGLLVIGLFILGVVAGKSLATNRQYRKDTKEYKELIKNLNHRIDSLDKIVIRQEAEAAEARDSSAFYLQEAQKSGVKEKIAKDKTNRILHETKAQMDAIDKLSADSAVREFSRRAEEYIRDTR